MLMWKQYLSKMWIWRWKWKSRYQDVHGIKASLLTREQKSRSVPWEAAAAVAAAAAAAALTQTASVFGREAAGAECSGSGVCSRIYMASFVQLQPLPRVSHWISVFLWPKRGLHKVEARHWHKQECLPSCSVYQPKHQWYWIRSV